MKEFVSSLVICCAIFYATVWLIGPRAGGWWCATPRRADVRGGRRVARLCRGRLKKGQRHQL